MQQLILICWSGDPTLKTTPVNLVTRECPHGLFPLQKAYVTSLCPCSGPRGLFNLGFWGLRIHRKLGWSCGLMLGSLPLHSLPCLAERCLQVLPLPRRPSRLGSLSHPVRFNPHLPGHSRFDLFRCPPGYEAPIVCVPCCVEHFGCPIPRGNHQCHPSASSDTHGGLRVSPGSAGDERTGPPNSRTSTSGSSQGPYLSLISLPLLLPREGSPVGPFSELTFPN